MREQQGLRSQKCRLPVLEISSPSSGAGKSQLLYYMAAKAVLPFSHHGIRLDGCGSAVVLLDTDARFDAARLRAVASGVVQWKRNRAEDERDLALEHADFGLDCLLQDALQHVHVFRPQSSSALLATLQNLDAYLLDLTRHRSAARPLHAILLDSASAFFWQDRLRDEVARTEEIGCPSAEIERDRQQQRSFHLAVLYRELVEELLRLQARFDCVVIYTTWGVSPAYNHQGLPSFKPHLPGLWKTFPVLRVVVQRDSVQAFGPETTVADAERDAFTRQTVVLQGKFSVWVDPWGQEDWPPPVVSALDWSGGCCSFAFEVTRDGVFLSSDAGAAGSK